MVFASSNELSFDATEKKNEKNQNQRHVNPNWVTSHNPRHRLSGVIICELSTIYFLLLVFFTLVSLVCFSVRVLFGEKKKKLSEAKINPPIWFTAAHLSSAHGNKVPLLSKRNEKRG